MRRTGRRWLTALLLCPIAIGSSVDAQDRQAGRVSQVEVAALKRIVDSVASGKLPGGDAWLKWDAHFLRGQDGKTYVPFTVTIDEAPGAFGSVAMYVRLSPRTPEESARGVGNIVGVATGEVPISTAERSQRGTPSPTPGEATAILRSLTTNPRRPGFPFEDVYTAIQPLDGPEAPRLQRALAAAPGVYDLYVAVRERPLRGQESGSLKTAVIRRELVVPDFSEKTLRMSSVILADRIEPLAAPLDRREQAVRPYALGAVEIRPAASAAFDSSATLSVAFFIYNAASDARGKPDIAVEYRVYKEASVGETLVGTMPAQRYDEETLPPSFNLKSAHELGAAQSLPLETLAPGAYRLRIRVTDNVTGAQCLDDVPFRVVEE
jgi:hypothetical protein